MLEILYGLQAFEYQHPADRKAMENTKKVIGLHKFGQFLEDMEREYQEDIMIRGTYLPITETNAPDIMRIFYETCEVLSYEGACLLYANRMYQYRISVTGMKAPIIQIPSAVLMRFEEAELRFVFGQILTILKSKTLPLFTVAEASTSTFGQIPVMGDALKGAIGDWYRKAQYSNDRGGLLACQDYTVAMQYLFLLSGIPKKMLPSIDIDAYVEQIISTGDQKKSLSDRIGRLALTTFSDRKAWANERMIELFRWYESGQYDDIILRHT